MSTASPAFAPTPEQAQARLRALARDGLTVALADLSPSAPSLQTSFGFGPEIWATATADPCDALVDLRAQLVRAARLVVDPEGRPASATEVKRHGLAPIPRIPRT